MSVDLNTELTLQLHSSRFPRDTQNTVSQPPFLFVSSENTLLKLTQSNAILRYLATCLDFYGDSETERTEIDVPLDEAYDFQQ